MAARRLVDSWDRRRGHSTGTLGISQVHRELTSLREALNRLDLELDVDTVEEAERRLPPGVLK